MNRQGSSRAGWSRGKKWPRQPARPSRIGRRRTADDSRRLHCRIWASHPENGSATRFSALSHRFYLKWPPAHNRTHLAHIRGDPIVRSRGMIRIRALTTHRRRVPSRAQGLTPYQGLAFGTAQPNCRNASQKPAPKEADTEGSRRSSARIWIMITRRERNTCNPDHGREEDHGTGPRSGGKYDRRGSAGAERQTSLVGEVEGAVASQRSHVGGPFRSRHRLPHPVPQRSSLDRCVLRDPPAHGLVVRL